MLIICCVTPKAVASVSRAASGVPMLTTISTSAPIARATSTGTLFTRPPSPSTRPSISVGENTPGTLMLERSASAKSPSERITGWPLSMSVATARKGIGNSSKRCTPRTGSV